jgi:hypothetical protein
MDPLRSLSPQRLQTTTSQAPPAPTAALTCRPWAGNHPRSKPSPPRAQLITATSTPSPNTVTRKIACTTRTTTSAGPTAPNRITTTPTHNAWATTYGRLQYNRTPLLNLSLVHPSLESIARVFLGKIYTPGLTKFSLLVRVSSRLSEASCMSDSTDPVGSRQLLPSLSVSVGPSLICTLKSARSLL